MTTSSVDEICKLFYSYEDFNRQKLYNSISFIYIGFFLYKPYKWVNKNSLVDNWA